MGFQHLDKYFRLVSSHKAQGLFCTFCVFFATGAVGGANNANSKSPVTEPLLKFAKLSGKDGDLETHNNHASDRKAVEEGKNFLQSMKHPLTNVMTQMDTERLRQVRENRQRLLLSLQNAIFLGRQGSALPWSSRNLQERSGRRRRH